MGTASSVGGLQTVSAHSFSFVGGGGDRLPSSQPAGSFMYAHTVSLKVVIFLSTDVPKRI